MCPCISLRSQISTSLPLRPAVFELEAILSWVHQMTATRTLNTTGSKVPCICSTSNSEPISLHFALWSSVFQLQCMAFCVKSAEWPQMTLKTNKGKPYTFYQYSWVLNFNLFRPTTSRLTIHFRVTDRFETIASNDTRTTLNSLTYKVKDTPYMSHYWPWVPNFNSFRSTTSGFRVTGHLEASTRSDPKWPWTLQGQFTPIHVHVLLALPSPKFYCDSLYE